MNHNGRPKRTGFTLVELMIVVSILGILATVAIPMFADLIRKSQEGVTKGNLGTLRSALTIYSAENEGQYPLDPTSLTVNGKYLAAIPASYTPPYHPPNTGFNISGGPTLDDFYQTLGFFDDGSHPPNESGLWDYLQLSMPGFIGIVAIACTHTDSRGTVWSSY